MRMRSQSFIIVCAISQTILYITNACVSRCKWLTPRDHRNSFIWNYRCKQLNLSVVLLPLAGGCVFKLHFTIYRLSISFFGTYSLHLVMLMIVFAPLLKDWDSEPFSGITIQTIGRLEKRLVLLLKQWTRCIRS